MTDASSLAPDFTPSLDGQGRLWCRCAACLQPYYVSAAGREFFKGHGFPLPKRCHACRQLRREARKER